VEYGEKPKSASLPHSVKMEDRCRMTASGVTDVESFDETEIIMNTSQGNLIVRGSGLHIGSISLDVGELRVEGLIIELMYEEKHVPAGSFWSKIFG